MIMPGTRPLKARVASAALLLAISGMMVSCQDEAAPTSDGDGAAPLESVTAALGGTSDLAIAARLINSSQLGEALDGEGSYTVFLPVDDAWETLGSEELTALESADGRPQLVAVLRQHIAPGTILQADMEEALERSGGSLSLATMGAGPIALLRDGDAISIGAEAGGPKLVGAPIVAGNDVIYRIDQLIPSPE